AVTVVPPTGPYVAGLPVELTAVPAPLYKFSHWSGDASGTSPVTTITMDSDKTVVAHFEQIV
ncbi:MAG: cell wall-binding protein, partial [Dehalococcoidia bacterium]|nr:cell wall-binding protein [Dehalococcoidia bacterium]